MSNRELKMGKITTKAHLYLDKFHPVLLCWPLFHPVLFLGPKISEPPTHTRT